MGRDDGSVSIDVASEFVWKMYGQAKETDVDRARLNKIIQMTGKVNQVGFYDKNLSSTPWKWEGSTLYARGGDVGANLKI